MKAFYRVCEVMEILNIGRTKAYAMIRAGVIPSVEIDGNIRIPAQLFQEWIEKKIASSAGLQQLTVESEGRRARGDEVPR